MKNPKTYSSALAAERSGEAERSEAGPTAVGIGHPNPEVVARAKRRIFTGEYKQRVLAEADKAKEESGGIGALLRREGLYSSHLTTWRHERAGGILQSLTPQKRGSKSKRGPLDDENQKLQRENQHLREELRKGKSLSTFKKSGRSVGASPLHDGPGAATLMAAVHELSPVVGTQAACQVLGLPRASYYRQQRPTFGPSKKAVSARALSLTERDTVLACLHEGRFQDRSPAAVFATRLDECVYHCSRRTMHRILEQEGETGERRDQLTHPAYQKPELLATAPNQLWSWDITKLKGPAKWTYFYLYVILDVFSRYVVGWMVAPRETAELAKRLIADTCDKQNIQPGQLTVHADRASSMTSKPVAFLLADLSVTKSHSRPYVSDDNPYSESHFRTLKYRPDFPERFGCIQDARAFCQDFFTWYNEEHRHSGIELLTPSMVHHGQAPVVIEQRQVVLNAAYQAHPERFVRSAPKLLAIPKEVWINKPPENKTQ